MKVILIAAMTPSGVIGRTSKPCGGIAHTPSADIYGGGASACLLCGGEGDSRAGVPPGRIPCNDLPWGRAYPEDLARFKALTMGHAVIMGRRTWESLGSRPLKGVGTSIVVSLNEGVLGAYHVGVAPAFDLPDAIECAQQMIASSGDLPPVVVDGVRVFPAYSSPKLPDRAFIIGGARLFAEALPIATHLDLTLIGREYEGDVLFPLRHLSPAVAEVSDDDAGWAFRCVSREPCPTNTDLMFTTWVRR